jgi:hypothetical protein
MFVPLLALLLISLILIIHLELLLIDQQTVLIIHLELLLIDQQTARVERIPI